MPTGRTGPTLESHGYYDNHDCKLSCYYHNHSLSASLQKVAGATKSDSGGPQNDQNTHFETPKLKKCT